MGHSAGGQLAALISVDPTYLGRRALRPTDIAGAILLDGAAYAAREQNRFLQAFPRTAQFFRALFGDDLAAYTPADRVRADVDTPPMLLLYASDRDYAHTQNMALSRALRAAGKAHALYPDRDATHVSMASEFGANRDRMGRRAAAFIASGRL
jgi:acetyl esterase/lipase